MSKMNYVDEYFGVQNLKKRILVRCKKLKIFHIKKK